MMTFCGTCNKWVQAYSIAQPLGTPGLCGHASAVVGPWLQGGPALSPWDYDVEATIRNRDASGWTTLLRRPAGYGAQYIMTETEALGQAVPRQEDAAEHESACGETLLDARLQTPDAPAASLVEPEPLAADLVRCRSCKKGYRWPMEASRTDEHHLCLRCEYKEGL